MESYFSSPTTRLFCVAFFVFFFSTTIYVYLWMFYQRCTLRNGIIVVCNTDPRVRWIFPSLLQQHLCGGWWYSSGCSAASACLPVCLLEEEKSDAIWGLLLLFIIIKSVWAFAINFCTATGCCCPPLAIKTRKFINAMLDVGEILSLEIHFISHSQLCTASDHEPKDDEGRWEEEEEEEITVQLVYL